MRKLFLSMLSMLIFFLIGSIALTGSIASAAPTLELIVDDKAELYNPKFISRLNEELSEELSGAFELREGADYRLEVRVLSMGVGKLANNGLATTISLGGSMTSLFVSPLSGSLLGALGWMHATKPVFAISTHVLVTRLSDGEIVYDENRLGRSDIKEKDQRPPQQVIEDAIEDAVEEIAKPLIKDSARNKKRIFISPESKK